MDKSRFRIIALRPITPSRCDEETMSRIKGIQKKVFGADWMYFYDGYELTDMPDSDFDEKGNPRPFYGHFLKVNNNNDNDGFLYDTGNLAVNFCAVIGPNGSGKSSAVELLIRLLNNFSVAAKGEKKNHLASEHLFFIEDVYGCFLAVMNGEYFQIQVMGRSVRVGFYSWCAPKKCYGCGPMQELLGQDDRENRFRPIKGNGFGKVQLDSMFYTAIFNYSMYAFNYLDYYDERTLENRWIDDVKNKKEFFDGAYTQDQCWLKGLFHKNDGYQTPIVINPMRDKGIIDVPKENKLAAERVRNMLFYENNQLEGRGGQPFFPFRMVNGHLEVVSIRVKPIENPRFVRTNVINTLEYEGTPLANNFDKMREIICRKWADIMCMVYQEKSNHEQLAWDYVVYKTLKIIETYDKYEEAAKDLVYFSNIDESKVEKWLHSLFLDDSHVTLKLRQALYFLKYKVFREQYDEYISLYDAYERFNDQRKSFNKSSIKVKNGVLSSDYLHVNPETGHLEMAGPSDDNNPTPIIYVDDNGSMIMKFPTAQEMMPPPIFDMTLMLIEKEKIKEEGKYNIEDVFPMSGLSSGERQIAGTISNFAYHIANIDSVWEDKNKIVLKEGQKAIDDDKRLLFKYKYVNVVFDEVELYFHPDLQRRFVKYLVDALHDLGLKHIEGVNIQLVTHSPFVLSDIPESNILCLSLDKNEKPFGQTFAANIYDLFNNRFILADTIGELAKSKILELVSLYDKQYKEWQAADDEKRERLPDVELKDKLIKSKHKFEYLISIVGDEYLHNELADMLDELVEFYNI